MTKDELFLHLGVITSVRTKAEWHEMAEYRMAVYKIDAGTPALGILKSAVCESCLEYWNQALVRQDVILAKRITESLARKTTAFSFSRERLDALQKAAVGVHWKAAHELLSPPTSPEPDPKKPKYNIVRESRPMFDEVGKTSSGRPIFNVSPGAPLIDAGLPDGVFLQRHICDEFEDDPASLELLTECLSVFGGYIDTNRHDDPEYLTHAEPLTVTAPVAKPAVKVKRGQKTGEEAVASMFDDDETTVGVKFDKKAAVAAITPGTKML